MNNKNPRLLCLLGLFVASMNAQAAIVSQTCVDAYDDYGSYDGYSCDTTAAYALEGTITLRNSLDGTAMDSFSITANMTQNISYTESMSMGSSSGETTTDLTIAPTGLGIYSMNRVDWLLDGAVTLGSFSESLTGNGYTLSGTTDWFMDADGILANLMTLDGDSDGINGMTLLFDGQTTIADVQLSVSAVPVPAAVWLFGSGLIGLIGVARRKARA